MGEKILTQSIKFEKKQIETSLMKLHPDAKYLADRIIYYPYYFFVYNVKAKRLFLPMDEKVGCAVDAISGSGSLVDFNPKLEEAEILGEQRMQKHQTLEDCLPISESFVFRSLSLKMRMISFSHVQVEKQQLFYRPFWVVYNKNGDGQGFIVDGVTGQYHPL
ncbi:hypothetical protein J2Z83_002167 [Virgibacillus natechei]|uniref:Uncharacterized protein n=1 Tax=Virgibacillus natechei TaxID=1216297 RepID=A0ABS4IGI0_9BACI|nr:hypothetical protein [Virgibacillus natechei]MBP1970051.1 hypothetical protein [Virgibacillus natechei]UZD14136.1 hypothetical protein OLD84_06345 [Virgibacillus natechei]